MTGKQARLLALRFEESSTEWRRLEDEAQLAAFLDELGLGARPAAVVEGERAFTLADGLIAETGTLVLSGLRPGSRRAALLAEEHWALVSDELVFDTLGHFLEAGSWSGRAGPALTLITGPSRTADIEKILVMGAHGPRRLVIGSAPAWLLADTFPEETL